MTKQDNFSLIFHFQTGSKLKRNAPEVYFFFFLNSQAADYLNIFKVWIMATQNILQSISIGKDLRFQRKSKTKFQSKLRWSLVVFRRHMREAIFLFPFLSIW